MQEIFRFLIFWICNLYKSYRVEDGRVLLHFSYLISNLLRYSLWLLFDEMVIYLNMFGL
jgi:hypothetical protein